MEKTVLLSEMLLLFLFMLFAAGTAQQVLERLGNKLGDPGPLYHDDQNLVNQVILINPSQQVQNAHLLITKWNVMWDYLNTEVKLQLWKKRYSKVDDLPTAQFTLQQETQLVRSNTTGRVSFSYSTLANHGYVIGIYFKTQNPIPYRRRPGACDDPRVKVWRLDRQLEPMQGDTHMFMSAQVNDMCRDYLIEPEYNLVDYAVQDTKLFGSQPVERPSLETEQTEIMVINPSVTLPSKSRVLGWKAYFTKPLTKVQFAVFIPGGVTTSTGGELFNLTYISGEYLMSEPGPFYARIDYVLQKVVPRGSVLGLKYLKENPIPYTENEEPCRPGSHSQYTELITDKEYYTEHFTMVKKTSNPCRQYSVQLVYEDNEAQYPEQCESLDAGSGAKEATSEWYNKADGIVRDSTKECWVIQGTQGVIQLEVHDLNLTTSHSCTASGLNLLEVRDGDTVKDNLLRTVCPGETGVIVTGCTSTMHLYLKSTDSITKKGLRFSYKTVSQAPEFCQGQSSGYSSTSTALRSMLSFLLLPTAIIINSSYFTLFSFIFC